MELEHHACRQDPKDADEARQKQHSLKEAGSEICRKFCKVMGVLMDTLIWVHADFASAGEKKSALGREPLREQVSRQCFAQFHLRRLIEPSLGDVQNRQSPGDIDEHKKLGSKDREVFARESIIKWFVPCVELNLSISGGADHGDKTQMSQSSMVRSRDA